MKRKKQRPAPRLPSGSGPVTNRRLANRPLPARARTRFLERGPADACPDDADMAEFFDAQMIGVRDE